MFLNLIFGSLRRSRSRRYYTQRRRQAVMRRRVAGRR